MWSRRLFVLFLGISAGLFDVSIASWFGGWASAIRVALPLVILLAAFSSLERSLTAAIAAGFVLDAFAPSFGVLTIRLALIACFIRAASQTYVTNRSVAGSLALGLLGLACDRVLLAGVTMIRGWSSTLFIPEIPPSFFLSAGWMCVVMTATFLLFVAFTRRFMPLLSRR